VDARNLLWPAWAASVSIVLVATMAVAAVPHARGIGFQPALRYAVVTPLCIGVTLLAAFLYWEGSDMLADWARSISSNPWIHVAIYSVVAGLTEANELAWRQTLVLEGEGSGAPVAVVDGLRQRLEYHQAAAFAPDVPWQPSIFEAIPTT